MSLILMNPRHRRSPKNLLLNDVFTDWETGYGIFSFLENKVGVPWSNTSSAGLDIAYHGERSGEKFVAPIVYNWIDEDGDLTSDGVNKLVSAIKARYYQKWEHLWSVYTAEYSPLNTYNITESGQSDSTGTDDKTSTRTPNLTEAKTGTDNMTIMRDSVDTNAHGHVISDSGTDTETLQHGHVVEDAGEPSTVTEQTVSGFNSEYYTPKSHDATNTTTDNTQTHSGSDVNTTLHGKTETHSGSDIDTLDYDATENRTLNLSNTTTGTDTTVDDVDTTSHNEYSSTKQGTMYRSPAELLSLDREFWLVDYFGIVFEDVDHMLTLGIYSEKTPTTKIF